MKTIEINVYQYSELSEEAKKKALIIMSDINVDFDWWNQSYDDAENVHLKISGFDTGRGETITIAFVDTARVTAEQIIKNHGDQCDTYKTARNFLASWKSLVSKYSDGIKKDQVAGKHEPEFDEKADELEALFLRNIGQDYLKILRDDISYRYTDEAIKETIEANEYNFTEEGERKIYV